MRALHRSTIVALALLALPCGPALHAQEQRPDAAARAAGDFPAGTVVARLHLQEGVLDGVTSSAELVAGLREHLKVDVAMPLDEPIQIDLRGFAGDEGGSGSVAHFLMNGLRYEGDEPLDDFLLATAMQESHADDFDDDGWAEFESIEWNEDEAWNTFVEALDAGLPQSSGHFQPGADGTHMALRVKAVRVLDFSYDAGGGGAFHLCCEGVDGPRLHIAPEVDFPSALSSDGAGESLRHERSVLIIELAPNDDARTAAAPAETTAQNDSVALALTQQMLAACDGNRIRDVGSSDLQLEGEPRTGGAVSAVARNGALTVLLGNFETNLNQCLVLMLTGGSPAPGSYPVEILSPDRVSGASTDAAFVGAFATDIGADATTHMGSGARTVVLTSGMVEITVVEPDVEGTFELEGWITPPLGQWIANGTTSRGDAVRVTGSFLANRIAR